MAHTSQPKEKVFAPRHPIAVVMGHIDHGKSTLLDYIRKTNVVEKEAGGITQHLSAYVVEHTMHDTKEKRLITFLDTPGHEAFQKMRLRGADVADIAILVVSAEEGVKPQTLEALKCIETAKIPYIVAINKIDRPGANVDRTKASLIENGIYVEGMGGDIPSVPISAKTGEGVDALLEVLLLASELAEPKGETGVPARGMVIEALLDPKRGTSATLIIKDGELKSGMFVVSGTTFAPVRIMENFAGKAIKEAGLSTPVRIVGFSSVPNAGDAFVSVTSKKEAEALVLHNAKPKTLETQTASTLPVIPICIKADVLGTIDAIEHEIAKLTSDRVSVEVMQKGVGAVSENDVKNIGATKRAIIVGFNVSTDRQAADLAERLGVEIKTFDIIYKLAEWLKEAIEVRTPKQEREEKTGEAKILKVFSVQKTTHVLGGRVLEGSLSVGQHVKVMRRDLELGRGTLKNLQQQKANVREVKEGEFGMQLDTKVEIAPGDTIAACKIVIS